jgi:hypothetical protein
MHNDKFSFWKPKSLRELAKEQGVKPVANVDDLIGKSRDLWKSDSEFEKFVAGLSRSKKAARI